MSNDDFYKKFAENDAYYLALMILYFLKEDSKYSVIAELVYLLDQENFLKFIRYFGGQEIKVPENDEIVTALKTILLYQYRVINKMTWPESLKKAGFNASESVSARGLYVQLEQALKKTKIGSKFLTFIGDADNE